MRRLCVLMFPLMASCDGRELAADYGLCLDALQQTTYYPQSIERDLDLLLVLDTSPAMQAKADTLAESLPRMVEALRTIKFNNRIPPAHAGR